MHRVPLVEAIDRHAPQLLIEHAFSLLKNGNPIFYKRMEFFPEHPDLSFAAVGTAAVSLIPSIGNVIPRYKPAVPATANETCLGAAVIQLQFSVHAVSQANGWSRVGGGKSQRQAVRIQAIESKARLAMHCQLQVRIIRLNFCTAQHIDSLLNQFNF